MIDDNQLGEMDMAKNICLIVQSGYPGDVRVRKEAMALLTRGHNVSVIALRNPGESRHEVIDSVKIYRIGLQKKRSGKIRYVLEYFIFFFLSFIKLNTLDFKEQFDVVHINTLPDFLVFSGLIQKLKGKKIVLDMHEIMPEFFMSKFGVGFHHPMVYLLRFLEKISLKFADEVITVNEPIKNIFHHRSIPYKPITVIMNTVSTSVVASSTKRDHRGFNCVYHGTLTDIYGLDTAIKGFSVVKKKFPDIFFHIYGNGQCLSQLKQLTEKLNLENSVIFHGAMTHEKVLESLGEMDLGILTMRKDVFLNLSFSNKLAEYVYMKIPTIISDLDSVKFYFNDDHILFYEAANTDDLAQKIEYAYLNRGKLSTMAESAYEHFKEYNWDVMAERYLTVIDN